MAKTTLWVIVIIFFVDATSAQFKVFQNTLDPGNFGDFGAGAILDEPGGDTGIPADSVLDAFTLCIRFQLKVLGNRNFGDRGMVMNIGDIRDKNNVDNDNARHFFRFKIIDFLTIMNVGYKITKTTRMSYLLRDSRGSYDFMQPYVWNHLCYSFRKPGFSKAVLNGRLLSVNFERDVNLQDMTVPLELIHKVLLMRCPSGDMPDCTMPGGMITDFNIWDRSFSSEDMKKWTTCRGFSKGNVVHWDRATWILNNVTTVNMKTETVCNLPEPRNVLFPTKRTFDDHKLLCTTLNGKITVVNSSEQQDSLITEFREKITDLTERARGKIWAGWNDEELEGTFTDPNTGATLSNKLDLWYAGEPNGGRMENCAMVWVPRKAWNDLSCTDFCHGFCHIDARPRTKLRGLRGDLVFDRLYTMSTADLTNEYYAFDGYTTSTIFFDKEANLWKMTLKSDSSIFATTNTTKVDYPFGTRIWQVFAGEVMGNFTLNFNGCDDDKHFNCKDGSCIGIEHRCDGRIHCKDASDEDMCDKIVVPDSYLNEVPVPPLTNEPLAKILLEVEIISVQELIEVDAIMTLQYKLSFKWMDSRITFQNLKSFDFLNTVATYDAQKIWHPNVVFFNTRDMEQTKYDEYSVITINRNGAYKTSTMTEIHNNHIYEGNENELILDRIYTTSFTCDFNMALYPFDVQECNLIFVLKGNSGNFTRLIADKLIYLGAVDLPQYFIKFYNITDSDQELEKLTNGYHGVKVNIIFSRRILNQILATFLPTIAIALVCFSTNFWREAEFNSVSMTNLTALLVLTTVFIATSNALPKTAYIKLIEVWLLGHIFVPFFEVILFTIIDYMRLDLSDAKEEMIFQRRNTPPKKIDKNLGKELILKAFINFGRYGFPTIYVILCAIFSAYGLAVEMNV